MSASFSRASLLVIFALAAGLFWFNLRSTVICGQNFGCLEQYWAQFWLISFSDGFMRRALLGEIMRACFGPSFSYVVINAISMFLAAAIVISIYALYFLGRNAGRGPARIVAFLLFATGPSAMIWFEVLGDPLHPAVVIFLLCLGCMLAFRAFLPVYAAMAAILMILIHEAAVFLVVPALYLVFCIAAGRDINYLHCFGGVSILAASISVFLSGQTPHAAGAQLILRDGSIFMAPQDALPTFGTLLRHELLGYFGSAAAVKHLIVKVAGVATWPVLALISLYVCCRDRAVIGVYLFLLILSSPLYLIAHDWGRFTIYTLLLSMVVTATARLKDYDLDARFAVVTLPDWLLQAVKPLTLIFPLLFIAHPAYRIDGLLLPNVVALVCAIGFLICFTSPRVNAGRPGADGRDAG